MHSKIFQLFFQAFLILSFVCIFTESAECQFGFTGNNIAPNLFTGEAGKTVAVARPRIYKEDSTVATTKKAATNFEYERRAFDEINQQRVGKGLHQLTWSDVAAKSLDFIRRIWRISNFSATRV